MQRHFSTTSPEGSMTETTNSCYDTSSEDGGSPSSWFNGMNNNISKFARVVGQNLDGFASAVNRGARNLIHELADLENETMGFYEPSGTSSTASRERSLGEQSASSSSTGRIRSSSSDTVPQEVNANQQSDSRNIIGSNTVLPLPWEICIQQPGAEGDSMTISVEHKEDKILKEKILALSHNDSVFTGPFSENHRVSRSFHLDTARVVLIQRLLSIDHELRRVHSKKVSGQMDELKESLFWQNYFYHCDKVREERQLEIHEKNCFKAHHDEELDAELVGSPPASCTGFYPKTGKLHVHHPDVKFGQHEEDDLKKIDSYMCDNEEFVMVEKEDENIVG